MYEKVKLKGHESFCIREGWITKGLLAVQENPRVFSEKDATDILGLGTNMVKSLKYWLTTANLIEEQKKSEYCLTELGKIILEKDPYIENLTTLYLIHMSIVKNEEKALIWNIFFNFCNSKEFTKKDLMEQIKYILNVDNKEYNENILIDEINAVLKTYTIDETKDTPENNFTCPLTELKLLTKVEKEKYQKVKSEMSNLNFYIVYWAIISQVKDKAINIEDLLREKNCVSKIFNLDKIRLNEYLEVIKREGLITINRTAGLNMIYIEKRLTLEEVIEKCLGEDE